MQPDPDGNTADRELRAELETMRARADAKARRKQRRLARIRDRGLDSASGKVPRKVPRSELPRCGVPTHPWGTCEACGEERARRGRKCPSCGAQQPPGPPCKMRVAVHRDTGEPRTVCRLHGGALYGPTTEGGRAKQRACLRRGKQPGPGELAAIARRKCESAGDERAS